MVALGVYFYLKDIAYDVSGISWLPIVSLSGVMFIVAIGVSSLPYVVIVELLPPKVSDKNGIFEIFIIFFLHSFAAKCPVFL